VPSLAAIVLLVALVEALRDTPPTSSVCEFVAVPLKVVAYFVQNPAVA